MNMTNQETRLLEYLKTNYTITPMEAWNELGIYRLSDVVFKLRNKNYEIETERKSVLNRFDEPCSFAEYKLLCPY
tara:strand:+ start:244 stop:468 length:225 start_codon:yes stop_codon:yes gene_type:complete